MTAIIRGAATVRLTQHLIPCPQCAQPAAVHVSVDGGVPAAARVVCAGWCADTASLRDAAIEALYPPAVA